MTVTEIKEQRERQKKEIELLKQAELSEIEEKKKALQKAATDEGCSWGIGIINYLFIVYLFQSDDPI